MIGEHAHARQPRTLLEQRIWERRETHEDFAEYATRFAREHGEPATLSARHVKRLVAGRGDGGKPIGRPQPATARLLERIFSETIEELLSAPSDGPPDDDNGEHELRNRLRASARVDSSVLTLLNDQLNAIRRLDRQMGAVVAHDEVLTKIKQVSSLFTHSLAANCRSGLAALLAELHALAGWQALDLGNTISAWQHYEHGKAAAHHCKNSAFEIHTAAEQAFVLLDIGDNESAVELLATTRERANRRVSPLLHAWLTAAHGEALASANERSNSLRAFDSAASFLGTGEADVGGPYVVLNDVHLARWRGHALTRIGDSEAITVLESVLKALDPTFTRAETALHVDLATAFTRAAEPKQARTYIDRADSLAAEIGSARQQFRVRKIRNHPLIQHMHQ